MKIIKINDELQYRNKLFMRFYCTLIFTPKLQIKIKLNSLNNLRCFKKFLVRFIILLISYD